MSGLHHDDAVKTESSPRCEGEPGCFWGDIDEVSAFCVYFTAGDPTSGLDWAQFLPVSEYAVEAPVVPFRLRLRFLCHERQSRG